jgi:K(+)-stimulated pyrophosphate-energized sodium pump
MQPINKGFWVSASVSVLGFLLVSFFYMQGIRTKTGAEIEWWRFFLATLSGIVMAAFIEKLTEDVTSTGKKPVTEIAYASKTGPATMIIQGFATGLESSVWSVVAIVAALLAPLFIFPPTLFGGGERNAVLSFYGIALTGLGLLTTTGYILAMDTFGPISDNANGIFEMSGALKAQQASGAKAGFFLQLPRGGDRRVFARFERAGRQRHRASTGLEPVPRTTAQTGRQSEPRE